MNYCLAFCLIILPSIKCINSLKTKHSRPNIIFIIGDDMGWNDVSYHGSDQISTPNIDALGYHGLMMERQYVQQACTPSRAALLTGQYPIRVGFQGYPLSIGMPKFIPKDVNTLPASLKTLGYSNHLVGKWHLGYSKREHTPLGYGYDSHFGYWNGYMGYFNHAIGNLFNGTDLHDNYAPVTDKVGQYATDLFTARAIELIENHPRRDSLHLVVSHLAGHTGKTNKDNTTELEVHNLTATNEKYSYIKEENRRKYAEIIERMDKSVGDIVEALAKKGMLTNSIIVFFSDNGAPTYGLHSNSGSNYPLRGIKMTMYEGAIRSPTVIFSPKIKRKSNVFNGLFHISDWMPTMFKAAGGNVKSLGRIDGVDQWNDIISNSRADKRSELLVDIDPKFNCSAFIGDNGRYKLVNHSYFTYNYSGDEGFSDPELHYRNVRLSKTNIYLETVTKRRLTRKKTVSLRNKLRLSCGPNAQQIDKNDVKPCDGLCLFDLEEDPCEYRNVAAQHPDIVARLSFKLENLRRQAMPKLDFYIDERSDPKRCHNTWFNWLDKYGCWYNNTLLQS